MEFIKVVIPVIGLVSVLIGILATAFPMPMSKNFGIPADEKSKAFIQALGVRDLFMGLIVLLLYFLHLFNALGITLILLGLVALGDFAIVFINGNKKSSLTHFLAAHVLFAIGIYLLI